MQAEVQEAGPCRKQLSIEISPEEVNEALREGMGQLQKSANVPGFRRGRAPLALIEKRFGGELRREVKTRLIADNYRKAIEEKELQPISEPEFDIDSIEMKEGEPLRYELTVEVWPEFEPEGYEGLKLVKPSSEPADEDIENEIANLQRRMTKFEEIHDQPAAEDDFILCDYTINVEGQEEASAEDVGVRPADGAVGRFLVSPLKEALTGKKPGDTVNLDFTVDEKHMDEKHRGKAATLVLSVKGIRRANVPDATDEWAKELGFESLEELRSVVARNVRAAKEREAEGELRRQVYDALLDMMKFDLPEAAVRRQQKSIADRERMGLEYRGATEEDIASINDELEESSLKKAERALKTFFILSKIAEKEGIQATAEDLEMRLGELAARYNTTSARMRRQLEKDGLLQEIALEVQEEKTVAHILSKAEIKEEAGTEPAPQRPEKPEVARTVPEKPGESEEKTDATPQEPSADSESPSKES